jgi:hypothetical protein
MGREEKEDKAISLELKEECQDQLSRDASMDEGTKRHQPLNVVFTGNFCLGW